MNIGAEHTKGDTLHRETYALLSEAKRNGLINFLGNIEGRDVPFGAADVVVSDGFSGNVLLKSMEGIGLFFGGQLKNILTGGISGKLAGLLVGKKVLHIKKMLNYKEIGGSPLIGINAPVIKAHGSADAYTMRSAILQAKKYSQSQTIGAIEQHMEYMKMSI